MWFSFACLLVCFYITISEEITKSFDNMATTLIMWLQLSSLIRHAHCYDMRSFWMSASFYSQVISSSFCFCFKLLYMGKKRTFRFSFLCDWYLFHNFFSVFFVFRDCFQFLQNILPHTLRHFGIAYTLLLLVGFFFFCVA